MYTLAELAGIINAELLGDPNAVVRRAWPFEDSEEGDITFAASPQYRARIASSRATAIIIAPPSIETRGNIFLARNPKLAFALAIRALHQAARDVRGVSEDLIIGDGTRLGSDLSIYPRVTIGRETVIGDRVTLYPGVVVGDRCRVGDDTAIFPNVTVYDDCTIGCRVVVHAGTVIGADGFGFVPDEEGRQVKVLQLGRVRIEDDCEIGANCTIDRGGFGDTVLRRGVKLDNLIQVGHNTELGDDTVVAALTGFSGGTRVGRACIVAGQVGTNQHVTIGDRTTVTARSGVTKSLPAGALVAGVPARDYNAWRRAQVLYSRLPEIMDRLKKLEKLVAGEVSNTED
ncbi:MAG TPA: UDP-3-O-(3-hydroxymyristoyl)glucosamine N-acyltransferase [Blastocatellia bacterium]|nr:UDP-3-O-(3-hydroxymyristoyl)glucosamine N-acyltransferase [Blastocatellia bacterium]